MSRRRLQTLLPVVSHAPAWDVVIERETTAQHCYVACLYREPEFARLFPQRSFERRYLAQREAIAEHLQRTGFHLHIWCDEAMLDSALSLGVGNVFRVTTPPAFPFQQHQWRYWSVMLPPHPTIRAYHFRGMDNIAGTGDQALPVALLKRFLRTRMDLLHAPYQPGRHWLPVRGSCSVAGRGIRSLRAWLLTHAEQKRPRRDNELWHNDELMLSRWFAARSKLLRLHTLVDRQLPAAPLQRMLARQIRAQKHFILQRIATAPSQLRKWGILPRSSTSIDTCSGT